MAMADIRVMPMLICLILTRVGETLQQEDSLVPSALQPPPGNRLVLKARTQNGKQMYECSAKNWMAIGASADLVMASNPSVPVGTYTSQILYQQGKTVHLSTWTLDNSAGFQAESGDKYSSVSGKECVTIANFNGSSNILPALLQATSHQFDGSASLISYVQRIFPQGGVSPPMQDICELDATVVEVPFEVQFWFWSQDLWPPAVPDALTVGNDEQPLQGFFAQGFITYRYSGNGWEQILADASLYNVPGGVLAGKVFVQALQLPANVQNPAAAGAGSSYWLHLNDQNGFQAIGRPQSAPVSVDTKCLPWSLIKITSYSSNNPALWNWTHVQIVATRGGLPSYKANFKPIQGTTLQSPFSALLWIYVKSLSH